MLSDSKILEYIKDGEIIIKPFDRKRLGSNSYDLTISKKCRTINGSTKIKVLTSQIPETTLNELPLALKKNECIIFQTNEIIGVKSKTVGLLSERSNMCRFPLMLNYSKLIDTGFIGTITAVLKNIAPFSVLIPENYRIMQVMFFEVNGKIEKDYQNREWSKNLDQFGKTVPEYKIDKEWL